MDKVLIKQKLIEDKPTAYFTNISNGYAYYLIDIMVCDDRMLGITFKVPLDDVKNMELYANMHGDVLSKWIDKVFDRGSFDELKKYHQNKWDNL